VTSTPALVADDAPVLHPLILAAQTFPVGDRAENPGAEQTVALGFEGSVIDSFRLGYFAVGPRTDFLRRGKTDPDCVKFANQTNSVIRAASKQCFLLD
jgi:hypothetical protein